MYFRSIQVTEILNSVQGILIFCLLIIVRSEVMKSIHIYMLTCMSNYFSTSLIVTTTNEGKNYIAPVRHFPEETN